MAEARPPSARSARRHVKSLNIRPPRVDIALGSLSGGNQQKVALAKWLTYPPKVLVLSEPTRGMDVGAKDDVVKIVRGLRDQGIGVVVVSTEPETVLSLADRILVMRKGRIVREFEGEADLEGPASGSGVRSDEMTVPETTADRPGFRPGAFLRNQMRNIAPFVTLIALVVFFSAASPSFATADNVANILTQISVTGVIAVGLTFVILCAEIDLSVAAIANATGIVVAYFTLQESYVTIANMPDAGLRSRSYSRLASCAAARPHQRGRRDA